MRVRQQNRVLSQPALPFSRTEMNWHMVARFKKNKCSSLSRAHIDSPPNVDGDLQATKRFSQISAHKRTHQLIRLANFPNPLYWPIAIIGYGRAADYAMRDNAPIRSYTEMITIRPLPVICAVLAVA